jgi:glycosyltransferase involved in cell wall biosynthesis
MLGLGTAMVAWLVLVRGVQVIVAKRPYEGFGGAVVKRVARAFGRRLALVVENRGDFEVFVFLQRRVRGGWLYRWLMTRTARYALRNADCFRAVSRSAQRQLEAWGCRQPIVLAPDWTDLDLFWRAGETGEPRTPGDVLYVGALVPRKGGHDLIDAMAQVASSLPTARLTMVGAPENPVFARQLGEQVTRLGLSGRVVFHRYLGQAELAARMARAQLVVLPTLAEGLPRVILEAMAAGTPVLATAVSGIPEVVEDGATGMLVAPGDVAGLAERLCWALTHPTEAAVMARRARALIAQLDPVGTYVRGYAALFEHARAALGGSKGSRP